MKPDIGQASRWGFVEVDAPTVLAFKLLPKSSLEAEVDNPSPYISRYCLDMNVDKTLAEEVA